MLNPVHAHEHSLFKDDIIYFPWYTTSYYCYTFFFTVVSKILVKIEYGVAKFEYLFMCYNFSCVTYVKALSTLWLYYDS